MLPITIIVLLLSFTLAPMPIGTLMLFLLGAAFAYCGHGLLLLGADIAMMPMGDQMGRKLGASGKVAVIALVCFLIGVTVTIAEPDLQVLAVRSRRCRIWSSSLTVAAGVGGVPAGLHAAHPVRRTPSVCPDRDVHHRLHSLHLCTERVPGRGLSIRAA